MSAGPRVSVRPARPADVVEIARIQRDTWRIAYERRLPPAALERITPELAEANWGAAVSEPPSPRHHVLVATEGDWLVGFTAVGPDEETGSGGITALLVEPRWGRRGHGSRLLAAATDHLRADGLAAAIVWIDDQDRSARDFYTSAGWRPDGLARELDAAGALLREIRLHTELTD